MKKAIVFMPKVSVGGMEKAFLNFIKFSDLTKYYEVDVVLGYSNSKYTLDELLQLPVNLNLICKGKWNLFSKILSFFKLSIMKCKIRNKYDLSICYSHHHKILANLTRISSKNNVIFIHTDLIKSRTKQELLKLQNDIRFDKFSNVVCVSKQALNSFMNLYSDYKGNAIVANNFIDGEKILDQGNISLDFDIGKNTFINISRHDDEHKKISYIINASYRLLNEGYDFKLLLVGDGPDNGLYRKLVKELNIDNNVYFTGNIDNPYKYLKRSSALVISSAYEGYGIVLDEARTLNVPIITTDVADSKDIVNQGYGIFADHSCDGIYNAMKYFLDNGFVIKSKFDYMKFNNNINRSLNKIFKG